jgi:hypothetical protein
MATYLVTNMAFLNTKWTTTRWVFPRKIRSERYGQLHGSTKYKDVFDQQYLDGLEKRRDILESRIYKLGALQVPLFLLLAFSLVNLDAKVSIAGFSIEGVRGLREILLVISSIIGVESSSIARQLGDLKELMKAATEKISGGQADARNFLNVRYGLEELSDISKFDQSLQIGKFQIAMLLLAGLPYLVVVLALVVIVLAVQFLTLREIWFHPNFSPGISVAVIVFVVATDIATLFLSWLHRGWQPFQTLEDKNKLDKLQWRDKAKYDEINNEIASQHMRRGFFSKLVYRPHMRRIK